MNIGIISDIHGNLDALEAVLEAAGEMDSWICLGDTVGYGPQPNECVERVRSLCKVALIGNHDLAGIGKLDTSWFNPYARAAAEWTQQVLSEESRSFLESLPEMLVRPEWDITFSHGSLTDPPRDYITTRAEARVNFRLLSTQALFIGHSHLSHCFSALKEDIQFTETPGVRGFPCDEEVFHGKARVELRPGYQYIINCGSVGQPRDGDPRAAWGRLNLEERKVDVFRIPYAIEAVQTKMVEAKLPPILASRLSKGY